MAREVATASEQARATRERNADEERKDAEMVRWRGAPLSGLE